jgi:hypothetical protein
MADMTNNEQKSGFFGFEHRKQPLLPRKVFFRRLTKTVLISIAILTGWVIAGVLGYHYLGQLGWVDSFLNAAMIVGGMGPVDILKSSSAKIFAGVYAIISGALFLTVFSLLAAPIFHRFLHKFHLEADKKSERKENSKSQ